MKEFHKEISKFFKHLNIQERFSDEIIYSNLNSSLQKHLVFKIISFSQALVFNPSWSRDKFKRSGNRGPVSYLPWQLSPNCTKEGLSQGVRSEKQKTGIFRITYATLSHFTHRHAHTKNTMFLSICFLPLAFLGRVVNKIFFSPGKEWK